MRNTAELCGRRTLVHVGGGTAAFDLRISAARPIVMHELRQREPGGLTATIGDCEQPRPRREQTSAATALRCFVAHAGATAVVEAREDFDAPEHVVGRESLQSSRFIHDKVVRPK